LLPSAGERPLRFSETELGGKLGEKSECGLAEALWHWSGKPSAGVMYIHRGCEAADNPHEVLKIFDGSLLHAKHTLERGALERGSGGSRHATQLIGNCLLTISAF